MKKCIECRIEKPPTDFQWANKRLGYRNSRCKLCYSAKRIRPHNEVKKAAGIRYRRKLKMDLIQGYGGACTCCGETEPVFLTIDHVNGGGAKHRATFGSRYAGWYIYRDARDRGFPPDYTILCWNCNSAKHILGICPHKTT
jgi:hypothetical protein